MTVRPLFLANEIYRNSSYGPKHPLAIQRIPLLLDLVQALGWLDPAAYVETPRATPEQIARFHDREYIAAVMLAEAEQRVTPEITARYNLGKLENPVYPEMFRRPATSCGASIHAADLLRQGGIVYSPAGGTHHARHDRAAGFCYFNDPVLGILAMLDQGLQRIAYVDIDVHHGDGVELAFSGDPRVRCLSVHEAGRWPNTGRVEDRAGGSAWNFPVPSGMNDSEMDWLADEALLPLVRGFQPDAIVVQAGCDALADDPLGRQELSNNALWRLVARLMGVAPRLLVLGGGGYNPWAVARAWAGVWATLNEKTVPDLLPEAAEKVLRQVTWHRAAGRNPPPHWFTTLVDRPNDGPVRDEVKRLVELAYA
jgi:acetoin utilization protein AcuC